MLGFSIFVVVIVALVFLFRLKRQKEITSFKDANFADFVDYGAEKDGAGRSSEEITEIAASVIAASARTIENQNAGAVAGASVESEIVYRKRETVFDDVTRSFLQTLYQVLDNNFQVLVKVLVTDLVLSENSDKSIALVSKDRVDFVVCQKADFKVVCGIQLHGGAIDRISEIFNQVDIPFINLQVGVTYSSDELRAKLKGVLPAIQAVQSCSRCNNPMSIKMARSGAHEGSYFWVCAKCKVTAQVR